MLVKGGQLFSSEVLRLFDDFGYSTASLDESPGQFFFAFLTEYYEVFVPTGKFIAGEKIFYDTGFAAFKESKKEVNGNLFSFFWHFAILLFNCKKFFQSFFLQPAADDAEAAGVVGGTFLYAAFAGDIVEAEPFAAFGVGEDPLGPEDDTVGFFVFQLLDDFLQLGLGVFVSSLTAPADEYFIGVMMVVAGAVGIMTLMVVVMMMVLMLVVVVAAFAIVMVMVMVMPVFMVMAVLVFVVMREAAFLHRDHLLKNIE